MWYDLLWKMFVSFHNIWWVNISIFHNITTLMWLFRSLWRHFWILVVLLSQMYFHTHSTVGETPPGNVITIHADKIGKDNDQWGVVWENLFPYLWESFKVEAMPDQENQVYSEEWAESLGWALASPRTLQRTDWRGRGSKNQTFKKWTTRSSSWAPDTWYIEIIWK